MVCNCTLAGTKACENCFNNNYSYGYNTKTITTTNIPQNDLSKEDYKEILKYLIDKLK